MGRRELTREFVTPRLLLSVVGGLIVAVLLAGFTGLWSFVFPSDEPTPTETVNEVRALGEQMDSRFDELEESIVGSLEDTEDVGEEDAGDGDGGDEAVAINVFSRRQGGDEHDWATSIEVDPGDRVEHLLRFENFGETVLEDVAVGANLPDYTAAIDGTTWLANGNNPEGILLSSDNITTGGIDVGSYAPGAVGYVMFAVEVDPVGAYERCGTYSLRTVGIVRPAGMNEHYNTTGMDVIVDCE